MLLEMPSQRRDADLFAYRVLYCIIAKSNQQMCIQSPLRYLKVLTSKVNFELGLPRYPPPLFIS